MSGTDYAAIYDQYWSRADRWGSSSFENAAEVAMRILVACGAGSVLDAGCGMGALVLALLREGVDARGVDCARRVVEHGNALAPERFAEGSVLDLPFPDDAFDTVVCTDVLEHLAPEDADRAIAELARVARSNLFVTVATAPDRDGVWHLTVRPRAWWEARFIEAGARKHPLMQRVVPYASAETVTGQATLVFEKPPPSALEAFPLSWLARERDLHMDMLREPGVRSEAHVARYTLAASFVRPGDTVLDAACGMGYGAHVLARAGRPARVIGIDASPAAVEYARANFATDHAAPDPTPVVEFRAADAEDLAALEDRSVDLVASFETLEHLAEPERFLDEVRRVLRPGGRLVVSVPNRWVDESGNDPNPHHLHVYDLGSLLRQVGSRFLLERAYAQNADGGAHRTGVTPSIAETPLGGEPPPADPEWWILVAMADPIDAGSDAYAETAYPDYRDLDGYNLTAFERDYHNPWLVRAMVSIGARTESPALLRRLAERTLDTAPPGSADHGAALCVLGYRLLDSGDADGIADLLARIDEYHARADDTPHAWRWRISNQYLAGLLLLRTGDREAARRAFLACADLDPVRFAPLLATKTVDALFRAGLLSACDGRATEARQAWTRGVEEARRVLSGDWTNVVGRTDRPVSFGLREAAQVLDMAVRCGDGLEMLDEWAARPGVSWERTATLNWSSQLAWTRRLERAKAWLEREAGWWRSESERRDTALRESAAEVERIAEARDWERSQHESWHRLADEREAALREQAEWIARLEEARDWAERQRADWEREAERLRDMARESSRWAEDRQRAAERLERETERLREWAAELERARAWSDGQRAEWERRCAEHEARIEELRAWIETLDAGKRRAEEEREHAAAEARRLDALTRSQRELIIGLETERERLRAEAGHAAERIRVMRAELVRLSGVRGLIRAVGRKALRRAVVDPGVLAPPDATPTRERPNEGASA
ncbi:MAG: methyltransferase domain-containing protein [Phycisphaerales bacterium]|nr:methyltransferase domain-containing protein [Phycisphaerales bacterium]